MQTDLATLKKRVLEAAKASPVSIYIDDLILESDRDDDGNDFLRVTLQLKPSDKASDEDFEALLETIEGAVGALDERYPSVRFADAA